MLYLCWLNCRIRRMQSSACEQVQGVSFLYHRVLMIGSVFSPEPLAGCEAIAGTQFRGPPIR